MKKINPLRRLARWLTRLLLRVGLLPASAKAETDTMGEWKRLQAEKDDPPPGLVLPDPNAPHAALIRRVRLYAQNGARALAPLLDRPLPMFDGDGTADQAAISEAALHACADAAEKANDPEIGPILEALALKDCDIAQLRAIHAAYNSPWTVVDDEVYEYESDKKRRAVQ